MVRKAKKNHAKQFFKKIGVFEAMFTTMLMLSPPEAKSATSVSPKAERARLLKSVA